VVRAPVHVPLKPAPRQGMELLCILCTALVPGFHWCSDLMVGNELISLADTSGPPFARRGLSCVSIVTRGVPYDDG
jgi:hypothetical protein